MATNAREPAIRLDRVLAPHEVLRRRMSAGVAGPSAAARMAARRSTDGELSIHALNDFEWTRPRIDRQTSLHRSPSTSPPRVGFVIWIDSNRAVLNPPRPNCRCRNSSPPSTPSDAGQSHWRLNSTGEFQPPQTQFPTTHRRSITTLRSNRNSSGNSSRFLRRHPRNSSERNQPSNVLAHHVPRHHPIDRTTANPLDRDANRLHRRTTHGFKAMEQSLAPRSPHLDFGRLAFS